MKKSRKRPLPRVIRHDRIAFSQFADEILYRDKGVLDAYYKHHMAWSHRYHDASTSPREEASHLFDLAQRQPRECLERIPRQPSSLNEAVAALCLRDLARRNVVADEPLVEAVAGCVLLASPPRRPGRIKDIVASSVRLLKNANTDDEAALKVLKAFVSILSDVPLYECVTLLDKVLSALFVELDALESLRLDLCRLSGMPSQLQNILLHGTCQPILGASLYSESESDELMDAVIVCRIRETPATEIVKIINLLNTLVSAEAAVYVIEQLHYVHERAFLNLVKKRLASIASQGAYNKVLQLICNAQSMDTVKGTNVFFSHFDRITDPDIKCRALHTVVQKTNKIVQVDILLDHLFQAELAEDDRRLLMAALSFACKDR